MVSFGEKAKIKKEGNLNLVCTYDITTATHTWKKISHGKSRQL